MENSYLTVEIDRMRSAWEALDPRTMRLASFQPDQWVALARNRFDASDVQARRTLPVVVAHLNDTALTRLDAWIDTNKKRTGDPKKYFYRRERLVPSLISDLLGDFRRVANVLMGPLPKTDTRTLFGELEIQGGVFRTPKVLRLHRDGGDGLDRANFVVRTHGLPLLYCHGHAVEKANADQLALLRQAQDLNRNGKPDVFHKLRDMGILTALPLADIIFTPTSPILANGLHTATHDNLRAGGLHTSSPVDKPTRSVFMRYISARMVERQILELGRN